MVQADAQTETEFAKQDEKLIRYYKKVIRHLQKQLEQAKTTQQASKRNSYDDNKSISTSKPPAVKSGQLNCNKLQTVLQTWNKESKINCVWGARTSKSETKSLAMLGIKINVLINFRVNNI